MVFLTPKGYSDKAAKISCARDRPKTAFSKRNLKRKLKEKSRTDFRELGPCSQGPAGKPKTAQNGNAGSSSKLESTQEPNPAQGPNPWPPGQDFPGDQNAAQEAPGGRHRAQEAPRAQNPAQEAPIPLSTYPRGGGGRSLPGPA